MHGAALYDAAMHHGFTNDAASSMVLLTGLLFAQETGGVEHYAKVEAL